MATVTVDTVKVLNIINDALVDLEQRIPDLSSTIIKSMMPTADYRRACRSGLYEKPLVPEARIADEYVGIKYLVSRNGLLCLSDLEANWNKFSKDYQRQILANSRGWRDEYKILIENQSILCRWKRVLSFAESVVLTHDDLFERS